MQQFLRRVWKIELDWPVGYFNLRRLKKEGRSFVGPTSAGRPVTEYRRSSQLKGAGRWPGGSPRGNGSTWRGSALFCFFVPGVPPSVNTKECLTSPGLARGISAR